MLCSPSALAPVFLAGHPPHGPKPGAQRQARVLENRARRHRSLIIALPTPQQAPPAGPSSPPSTAGTHKTLWPAQLHQILATRLLSGKTPLKLLQRPRVVLHSPACYMLGSRESSAYPDGVILVSGLAVGACTPPVGNCLNVCAAVSKLPIGSIFRGAAPFLVANITALLLITLFPELVLWLPSALMD